LLSWPELDGTWTSAASGFNEVTWTRYPQGRGQITAHRDPDTYQGLMTVVTLEESAPFHVFDDEGCSDPFGRTVVTRRQLRGG
jgi:hypothetical protein